MSDADTVDPDREPVSIDPTLYDREDVHQVLAALDIGALYRTLQDAGVSQRQIAALTGQSQSEVSDIIAGHRKVENYQVLTRIATGLGIPPHRIGLSWWAPDGTYCGVDTVAELPEGVDAEMLRRHLLALGATTAFGAPISELGQLLKQAVNVPPSASTPTRLCGAHVVQVRDLTRGLRAALLDHGSNPAISSAAAAWAERLLTLPGPEKLTQNLKTAVAELHAFTAGWSALDAGLEDRALYHYSRALELATEIGQTSLQAIALACAGLTMLEHGHPNEGLKMLQFGQVTAWSIPPGQDRAMIESCALADAAVAYAELGDIPAAVTTVAKSRQLWSPACNDPRGDQDYVAARVELCRGRLDAAEPFAMASVSRWNGVSQLRGTSSAILLATIHVQAGEPDGLTLAHRAILDVATLSSTQTRTRLHTLATALAARPGADTQDLARMARQVVATRV